MIEASTFFDAAKARGYGFYTGVPCSFLTPFIGHAIGDTSTQYVAAASEGEAVAIAAGAALAGERTIVMCQNSGLGNAVNPFTSLNYCFKIPTLLVVTWRGEPGLTDEPQHELMGVITHDLLDTIKIAWAPFPTEAGDVAAALETADRHMDDTGLPFAFVMSKGSVKAEPLRAGTTSRSPSGEARDLITGGKPPSRYAALGVCLAELPESAAIIATTGKCGRELFTLADRDQHFYQVGSMGCASGMGLGLALNVSRPVVVIDGDGAALMKMGSFATIGAHGATNLIHIVLDNGTYDSTGGQPSVSGSVDFSALALACGYQRAAACDDLEGFETALRDAVAKPGPALIHLKIAPGSIESLGRPTISPPEVAERFRAFLSATASGEG